MKIENIPGRFLFCSEKAVMFEPMTEGQTGPDKKSPGVLFFCVRRDQYRLMLNKSVPYQNLIADHKTPNAPANCGSRYG
jgi:hypothetical protein